MSGTTDSSDACPACGAAGMRIFHTEERVPVHSCLLLDSQDGAQQYPRGEIRLGFCEQCGFISNTAFDESKLDYSASYEETQGFSPRFREFASDLARRWVEEHDLAGKTALEIGCGKGDFLVMMCEAGVARGIGVDPSVIPDRVMDSEAASRVEWIQDFYSERYAHLDADALVCRHTLEHIQPVGDFMRQVRASIGDRLDTVVLLEVPDVLRVLREVAFWDVYYEHCAYFTPGSLARLLRSTGFEVTDLKLDYDDQYILIEARPVAEGAATGQTFPIEDDMEALREAVEHFSTAYPATIGRWEGELSGIRAGGGRAVIWGAGSKGVAYLNALGEAGGIEYAVDINPHKHGMFLAGTGRQIVAPDFLREYRPSVVIAMNPIYCDEIRDDLQALGVNADLLAV